MHNLANRELKKSMHNADLEDDEGEVGDEMEEGRGDKGVGFFAEPSEEQGGEEDQEPVGCGPDREMREREQGRGDEKSGSDPGGQEFPIFAQDLIEPSLEIAPEEKLFGERHQQELSERQSIEEFGD